MKDLSYLQMPLRIDSVLLKHVLGVECGDVSFDGISDVHGHNGNALLTFLSDPAFVETVNTNPSITGVFCREPSRALLRDGIQPLVVDDPKFHFFTLMDWLARERCAYIPNTIGRDCVIAPSASIAPHSVQIGDRVTIEPGAFIAAGTVLADDVIVRANASIGVDGFQHQRTSRGMVSPLHCGLLFVGARSEIGYSANISRGFSYRHTLIGADVKTDAFVYIGHGTEIGDRTLVCAHACVMGHVAVGSDAWIGPNSTVTSRARIGNHSAVSLGSVVTKDIPDGERYSGNFAIPHDRFIANLKSRLN